MSSKQLRVFISHSHTDNAFGVRLAEDLRRALGDDQSVWYDVSGGLHGGDTWWRKIIQEITDRPIFLVVLSPDAMESRWVNDEIDLAWNLKNTPEGKTILPVLYRECQPRADLRTRHIISFAPPATYEAALAQTLAALGAPSQPNPASATTSASPPAARPTASGSTLGQIMPQIEAAYGRRDWSDVMRKAEFLMRRAPDLATAAVHRLYGVALMEEGEAQRAREELDTALALDPFDLDAMRAAARVSIALGDPELAHTQLDDALALAADDELRLRLLSDDAFALRLAGHEAEEVRRCDEALRLAPDDAAWTARRIEALARAHRIADAQAEMEQLARRPVSRVSADAPPHIRADAQALRVELERESQTFRVATSDDERVAAAERFAALLTRNLTSFDGSSDPLSPQRQASARLPERLAALGYVMRPYGSVEVILPPLCAVPAGRYLVSDGVRWEPGVAPRDLPHKWAESRAFSMMRSPVTVAEYACFVRANYTEPQRWGGADKRLDWQVQLTRPDHPVVCVTWHDALAYAAWLSEATNQRWRLPTEAEWEKTARWDAATQKARGYPWGDAFDPARCNSATALGQTSAVGSYPEGASPCGALDMAGNVWEWVSNLASDDTASANDEAEPAEIAMLRGGSWFSGPSEVSGVARLARQPNGYTPAIGFRLLCLSA